LRHFRSVGSSNRIYFLGGEGEIVLQAVKGNKSQKQQISLRKETISLCSGKNGVILVSDGYDLIHIHNGLAKCNYKALHRIRELQYFAGKLFIVDGNTVTSFDNNGGFVWQYWHGEPINQMAIKDGHIEFVDENNFSFRISVKKGKLDEHWFEPSVWVKWDLGKEGWLEKLSDIMEMLSAWMSKLLNRAKTHGRARLHRMLPIEYRISLEMSKEKRVEDGSVFNHD